MKALCNIIEDGNKKTTKQKKWKLMKSFNTFEVSFAAILNRLSCDELELWLEFRRGKI